jgi:ankyrin repeat protein
MSFVEMECDYDQNPTNLYLLLQQKDWQGVKYQANNFAEEVQTFVFRKDSDGLLKWRLLPLHLAILDDGVPLDVLETLLQAYPAAADVQDDHGMLPIHLSIKKHLAPDVINLLLAANPACIDVTNHDDLTPYQMAQKSSSPHKKYYVRALRRGSPTYSAVTATLSDLLCGVNFPSLLAMDPRMCLTAWE